MPFYVRVPLPGPLSYGHRIGGRRRNRSGPATAPVAAALTTAHAARVERLGPEVIARRRRINAVLWSVVLVIILGIVALSIIA